MTAMQLAFNDYDGFVEKFKPKKTTDDCYTPQPIYDAIKNWVVNEYDLQNSEIIRPFKPGGDYESEDYPVNSVVIDNPPFSILAKIRRFYQRHGIRYFLFAPALTLFAARIDDETYIPTDVSITYSNGAAVSTSFITNLDDCVIRTAPDLYDRIDGAAKRLKQDKPKLPKYTYPPELVTATRMSRLSKYGVELKIGNAVRVTRLDSQPKGKGIFGNGFLISETDSAELKAAELKAAELKAAELKAAELKERQRADAYIFTLSEREQQIVDDIDE